MHRCARRRRAILPQVAPDSLICLTGVGAPRRTEFDIGLFNRSMVLNNGAVFGSVNANLRHYQMAADALPAPIAPGCPA
jgi:hypothetical protein